MTEYRMPIFEPFKPLFELHNPLFKPYNPLKIDGDIERFFSEYAPTLGPAEEPYFHSFDGKGSVPEFNIVKILTNKQEEPPHVEEGDDMYFVGVAEDTSHETIKYSGSQLQNDMLKSGALSPIKPEYMYRIEINVAGISKESAEVVMSRDVEGTLIFKRHRSTDTERRVYLHEGLNRRNEEYSMIFKLPEFSEVVDCEMKDGVLTIDIKVNIPDDIKPTTIEIR